MPCLSQSSDTGTFSIRCSRIIDTWCAAPTDSPARNLLRGEIALLLAQALEQLPHEYRVAVEQRFIDGRRMREIAEQLETSVGVVAGRLRRGLELLRDRLPDELQEFLEGGC